jgi:glycosyltransferase involved in cell wall biosynthesis
VALTQDDASSHDRQLWYVISQYSYQSTFIVREIAELAARGWSITVVSLRPPVFTPGSSQADLPYQVLHEGFFSANVLCGTGCAFTSSRWRALAEYVRLVTRTFGPDIRQLIRNLAIIPQACYYAAAIRRERVGHIHAHWATVSTSAAMLISRLSGVPFSFTGHAWDIYCDTRLLAEKGRAARFVLTCTQYNRRHLLESAGIENTKVHVLYHGLHLPTARNLRSSLQNRPIEILTVGRWSEKKGFLELVKALSIIRDHGVDFKLQMIVGKGSSPYERRVRDSIAALGLTDQIRTSGWLPPSQVEAEMRASDLFVLPCVTPAHGGIDGIPNVLIEALSVGLPVIATSLSGIPELIQHGETGVLVRERDPEDLARALVWASSHMGEMQRLGTQGRRLVERKFNIHDTISSLEQHFSEAIQSP